MKNSPIKNGFLRKDFFQLGFLLAAFLLLVIFGSLFSLGVKWFFLSVYEPEIVFSAQPSDKNFYETASSFKKKKIQLPQGVAGMIVPHHLLAADLIAEAFSNLNADDYETVVLISPNHFNIGEPKVLSSAYSFATPYGLLEADRQLFGQLAKEGAVLPNEEVFGKEHGILGEVAFIKKYLPEVKVLPLVLSPSLSEEEIYFWAEKLVSISRAKRILVVLSADFSHYKSSQEAQVDDKKSLAILSDGDPKQAKKVEIDTKSGLAILMAYAKSLSARFQLLNNSNSALLSAQENIKETTSYITGYFSGRDFPGGALPLASSETVDFLFVGDLMLDRHVKEVMGASGLPYIFSSLEEKGFFAGYDFISANLEGAVTNGGEHYPPANIYDFAFSPELVGGLEKYGFNYFTIANNHISDQGKKGLLETVVNLSSLGYLFSGCADREIGDCSATTTLIGGKKIGLLSFSMVYGRVDEDKLLREISKLASESDWLIVQPHWGIEYEHQPAANQRELARQMAEAGADLIIAHHPHVVQGVEVISGVPVFYSLGNFVFDQYFSIDTQEELAVAASFSADRLAIKLIPLRSEKTKLRLMSDEEKNGFLKKLSNWSFGGEEFKAGIEKGEIIINKAAE